MISYASISSAKEAQVGYGQKDLYDIYIALKKTLNTLIDLLLKMIQKLLSIDISVQNSYDALFDKINEIIDELNKDG